MKKTYKIEAWGRPSVEEVDKMLDSINKTMEDFTGEKNMVHYRGLLGTVKVTAKEEDWKKEKEKIVKKLKKIFEKHFSDVMLKVI